MSRDGINAWRSNWWKVVGKLLARTRWLLLGAVLAAGLLPASASLESYDTAIADDAVSGLPPTSRLTAPVTFNGANFYAFDFGSVSGAAAIEFIVGGSTPSAAGYLAVGANVSSNLRFEQFNNTGQMGFTQNGVTDYLFSPPVPTPSAPRHIAYVWNGGTTMQLYVDGNLAGTASGVSPTFTMPSGVGRLGADPNGGQGMTGTIYRMTVYDTPPTAATIKRHADAYLGIPQTPRIMVFQASPPLISAGGSSQLSWQVAGADEVKLGEVTVNAIGTQSVSPAGPSTTYTLKATNQAGAVTATATVQWTHPADHLVISEVVAQNENSLADEDGDFPDWIEVYNPSATAVPLAGWYLTDDPARPNQWAFPAATLPAGGYAVVFASGKNRAPLNGPWHANFSLNKDGEYLALVGPGGSVVHAFAPGLPAAEEDGSYGVIDGDPSLAFHFGKPTPGAPNAVTSARPRAVTFSVPSGLVTGTRSVGLSCATPGAQIFYSINGSAPTAGTGLAYAGALTVGTTTRVRAVAVVSGLTSAVAEADYVFAGPSLAGYTSPLPLLVIENFGQGVIPAKGWSGNGAGVQQVPRQMAYWATFERNGATASFGGAPQMQSRIGVRGRGAYSTTWAQKPLSVEAVDGADAEAKVGPLSLPAHADWVLYYPDPGDNKDLTLLFNTFAYGLAAACGHEAPRFRFVEAFVNEDGGDLSLADRRGIYVLMEKASRGADRLDFDKLSADGTAGSWLVNINRMDAIPETGWPAANGATTPQFFHTRGPDQVANAAANGQGAGDDIPRQSNAYINFDNPSGYEITTAQRASIETWFQQFEAVLYNNAQWLHPTGGYRAWLDAQDFAEYFIFNTLTHNGDGLLLSMFPWRGRDGRLRMGPVWDYNFGAYYVSGSPTVDVRWRSNQLWYPRLFADPDFDQLFIDRWTVFRRGAMSNAGMVAIIDAQAGEITSAKAVQQGLGTAANWDSRLTQMKSWLQQRANWIDSQFVTAPQLSQPGGNVAANSPLGITAPVGTVYYTLDGSDPRASGGAIATGAQTTLPVVLNGAMRVTARARNASAWSGPTTAAFVAGAAPARTTNLAITEIHYHPAATGTATDPDVSEFVELQNIGNEMISLLGVRFVRTGNDGIEFDFSSGSVLQLAPGEHVLVVKNRAAFEVDFGGGLPVAGEFAGNLANAGDALTLVDAQGGTLRRIVYSDRAPWPTAADGGGYSLVLADPASDPTQPRNWRTSTNRGGSPGESDTVPFSGNLLEYALGSELPGQTFDLATGVFSHDRRPGSDAVTLLPECSTDLQTWSSGPDWFAFAGETRAADGAMQQRWQLIGPTGNGRVFLRVRVIGH